MALDNNNCLNESDTIDRYAIVRLKIWHPTLSGSDIESVIGLTSDRTKNSPRGGNETYCVFTLSTNVDKNGLHLSNLIDRYLPESNLLRDMRENVAEGWVIVTQSRIPLNILVSKELSGTLSRCGLSIEYRIPDKS